MIYSTMGAVEEPAQASTFIEETAIEDWMIPVPAAQTIFSLVPAVAGGLAGIILAWRFTDAKAIEVKGTEVIWATALSFVASFGAVFMMNTFRSYED